MKRIILSIQLSITLLLFIAVSSYANDTNTVNLSKQAIGEIQRLEYQANEKTGYIIFKIDSELQNNSDQGIMEIQYQLRFLEKAGEEIVEVTCKFNGQDTPLKPGTSVTNNCSGAFKGEREPDSVSIEISKVITEEEMPPIYVPKAGDNLYQVLNDPNLENILEEPPVSVKMWIDHGGVVDEGVIESPEEIAEFVKAFTLVKIREETNIWVTDNYNGLIMEFANGDSYLISLNLHNLEYTIYGYEHIFTLMDAELFWEFIAKSTHPTESENFLVYD